MSKKEGRLRHPLSRAMANGNLYPYKSVVSIDKVKSTIAAMRKIREDSKLHEKFS